MKEIIILGASGSIGRQTLDVIRNNKDKYKVKGLSLGRDLKLACEILNEFKVEFAVMRSKEAKDEMEKLFPNIAFSYGEEGLIQLATYDKENKNILLVVAVVGSSGLKPTVEAIKIGRNIIKRIGLVLPLRTRIIGYRIGIIIIRKRNHR